MTSAPAAYWWASAAQTQASMVAGRRASPMRIVGSYPPGDTGFYVELDRDITWDNIKVLSVWCEAFDANFGHLVIGNGPDKSCDKLHPFVGFKGPLSSPSGDVSADVEVLDDCSFAVENYNAKDVERDAYFWGSNTTQPASLSSGKKISLNSLQDVISSEFIVQLANGITWSDFNVLSVWIPSDASALGSLVLAAGPRPEGEAPKPEEPAADDLAMEHCIPLTDRINMRWRVNVSAEIVNIAIDANLEIGKTWVGFGLANPASSGRRMIGADVTIVGYRPISSFQSEPFAIDYFLENRDQCNYNTGANVGVCPDDQGFGGTNDAKLVRHDPGQEGVWTIEFTRPFSPADAGSLDQPISMAVVRNAIFAWGPLSEDLSQPIVLKHGNGPGNTSPYDFKIDWMNGPAKDECIPLGAVDPVDSAERLPVSTICGPTDFFVTLGANPNYPNPPAWGVSYKVNGLESPTLVVVRGVRYRFYVGAGASHPLYVVDSNLGGTQPDEVVYAGNSTAFGVANDPYVLSWTPNSTTPDVVYYMCTLHQKIGWKIIVQDAKNCSAVPTPAPPPELPVNPGSSPDGFTILGVTPDGTTEARLYAAGSSVKVQIVSNDNVWSGFGIVGESSGGMRGGRAVVFQPTKLNANRDNCKDAVGLLKNMVKDDSTRSIKPAAVNVLSCSVVDSKTEFSFELTSDVFGNGYWAMNASDAGQTTGFMLAHGESRLFREHGSSSSATRRFTTNLYDAIKTAKSGGGPSPPSSEPACLASTDEQRARQRAWKAHAWFMTIAWGILLPCGVFSARFFRKYKPPAWFRVHRAVQSAGLIFSIVGFIIAVTQFDSSIADVPRGHGIIGTFVMLLALCQPLGAYFRPHADEPKVKVVLCLRCATK